VPFPVNGTDTRFAVELSGLPVFDRDRNFRGYRGFGICRDVVRTNEPSPTRRAATPAPARVEPPVFRDERPTPATATPVNVVPFPAATPAEGVPTLTPVERNAFSELATRLTARLRGPKDKPEQIVEPASVQAEKPVEKRPVPPPREPRPPRAPALGADQRPILDRLPVGVLVYRLDKLIYANRAFLDWTGYDQLHALEEAGGLDALFVEPKSAEAGDNNGAQSLTIATNQGDQVPVDARLFSSPWEGESALILMLTGVGSTGNGEERQKTFESALRHAKAEVGEVRDILDAAADGVVVL
jgi:PAS domain-containing protein